jgi:hypothetical protein
MPRFSLKHLLIGFAIIAAGLVALLSLKRLADPFGNVAFTPAAWSKADEDGRARMSRDLVNNHLPRGLSQNRVEALIGRTDWIIKPTDIEGYRSRGAETHVYRIGNWSLQSMDDAFVYIHYDASGNVISAEITGY